MHKEPSMGEIHCLQVRRSFLCRLNLTMQPQFRANIDGKVGNKTGYIIERQRNNKERIEIDSQLLAGGRQMV